MRIAIGKKDPETGRYVFPVFIPFLIPITLEMEKVEWNNDRAPAMILTLSPTHGRLTSRLQHLDIGVHQP